jgi:hypothetical protein
VALSLRRSHADCLCDRSNSTSCTTSMRKVEWRQSGWRASPEKSVLLKADMPRAFLVKI